MIDGGVVYHQGPYGQVTEILIWQDGPKAVAEGKDLISACRKLAPGQLAYWLSIIRERPLPWERRVIEAEIQRRKADGTWEPVHCRKCGAPNGQWLVRFADVVDSPVMYSERPRKLGDRDVIPLEPICVGEDGLCEWCRRAMGKPKPAPPKKAAPAPAAGLFDGMEDQA